MATILTMGPVPALMPVVIGVVAALVARGRWYRTVELAHWVPSPSHDDAVPGQLTAPRTARVRGALHEAGSSSDTETLTSFCSAATWPLNASLPWGLSRT